jgi:type II secretory pathway component PulK
MTLSTDGMRWEGLFRALQGDISAAIAALLFIGLLLFLASRIIAALERKQSLGTRVARTARVASQVVALGLAGIALIPLVPKMAAMIAANRIPRADTDKSAVYDQMRNNVETKK